VRDREIRGVDRNGIEDPGEPPDLYLDEFPSEANLELDGEAEDGSSDVLEEFATESTQGALPVRVRSRSITHIAYAIAAGAIAAALAIAVTARGRPAAMTRTAAVRAHSAEAASAPTIAASPAITPSAQLASRPPARAGRPAKRENVMSQLMPELVITRADAGNAPLYSPSFGATGTSMFFHAGRTGTTSLMQATLAADGSIAAVETVLRDGSTSYHIQESPAQSQIAFDSDREGERAVYVADRDGSHARRISGVGYAAVPRWSPDGTRLVFVRAEPQRPKVWNLWMADLTTSTLRRLTSHKSGQSWGGSWFPDGVRLAYSFEDRLVILDTATGAERVYRSPVRRHLVRTPAVSPDGRLIVFQVYTDGTWELNVPDGSMRRILDDKSAEEFAWTPDGAALAYHSRRSGEWSIWRMAAPL